MPSKRQIAQTRKIFKSMKIVTPLVDKGYKQAAFMKKINADLFSTGWKLKGYKTVTIGSTGPTVEQPHKKSHAYYVIAYKGQKSLTTIKRVR